MASKAEELAIQNRNWALAHGEPLEQQLGGDALDQLSQGEYYGNKAGDYYDAQTGSPGYSSNEIGGVLGDYGNGGVPGLDTLSGREGDNFLTEGEQGDIRGNPNDPLGYLHSDTIGQYMTEGGQAQDAAVSAQRDALGNAIDPSKLRMSERYGGDLTGQVGDTSSKLDTITQDPNLDLSSEFSNNYDLTPEQQQDMINRAGRTVGNQNQGALEAMRRQSSAAGVGPLGQQAREARMNRDAAVNSADAITDARIAANSEAAKRMQVKEGMRLGAGQHKAELGAQAAEYSGTQGLSALENIEGTRLGAERDISNRGLEAATTSGAADIANKQRETATNIGAVEDVRNAEVGAHQTAEQSAAGRAAAIAKNRQDINQQNYGRGMAANAALSERYGDVGKTRIAQRNVGGAGLTQQQQIRDANANTARGQQIQTMGTTEAATGNAANTVGQVQNQPGTAERIFGTILNAGAKVAGAAAGAGAFEDGGIVTEPTDAMLGEGGPEMVVPLGRNRGALPRYGDDGPPAPMDDSGMAGGAAMMPDAPPVGQPPLDNPNANFGSNSMLANLPPAPPPAPATPIGSLPRYGAPPVMPMGKPGYAIGGLGQETPPPPMQGTGTRPQAPMQAPPQSPFAPTGTRPGLPPPMAPPSAPGNAGATMITQPTRARLGQNGPEAVIPMQQNQKSKMRPGMFRGGRYGAQSAVA